MLYLLTHAVVQPLLSELQLGTECDALSAHAVAPCSRVSNPLRSRCQCTAELKHVVHQTKPLNTGGSRSLRLPCNSQKKKLTHSLYHSFRPTRRGRKREKAFSQQLSRRESRQRALKTTMTTGSLSISVRALQEIRPSGEDKRSKSSRSSSCEHLWRKRKA